MSAVVETTLKTILHRLGQVKVHLPTEPLALEDKDYLKWVGNSEIVAQLPSEGDRFLTAVFHLPVFSYDLTALPILSAALIHLLRDPHYDLWFDDHVRVVNLNHHRPGAMLELGLSIYEIIWIFSYFQCYVHKWPDVARENLMVLDYYVREADITFKRYYDVS